MADIADWFRGPDGPLWLSMARLVHSRQTYRMFMDLVVGAPSLVHDAGGEFINWVRKSYADSQAIGVRRLNSPRRDDISLRRALMALESSPPSGLTPAEIRTDKERLSVITQQVASYATKVVAHHDLNSGAAGVTWEQLHRAIDDVSEMFAKYEAAVLDGVPTSMKYVMSEPWEAAFTVAWLPSPNQGT